MSVGIAIRVRRWQMPETRNTRVQEKMELRKKNQWSNERLNAHGRQGNRPPLLALSLVRYSQHSPETVLRASGAYLYVHCLLVACVYCIVPADKIPLFLIAVRSRSTDRPGRKLSGLFSHHHRYRRHHHPYTHNHSSASESESPWASLANKDPSSAPIITYNSPQKKEKGLELIK
jgi:hypothetical protein